MGETVHVHSNAERHRIIVFARAPRLGKVKTRLNKALPHDQVLQLHESLVRHTIANAFTVSSASVELWVDENPSHSFFQNLQVEYPALSVELQIAGDLGVKMSHALSQSSDERQASVIIGSDCPAIDGQYIEAAINALNDQHLVIGPAADGGYVLICTKQGTLPVFDGIDWGTEQVLRQTLQLAVQSDLKVRLMAELNDIDHPFDLAEAHRFGLMET